MELLLNNEIIKNKKLTFLFLLLCVFLFSHNGYAKEEVLIYGNKFYVEKYLDLGDKIEVEVAGEDVEVVDKKLFNYFIIKNSLKDNSDNSFDKVCDNQCLFNVFKQSLQNRDFYVSSLILVLLEIKDIDGNFSDKIVEQINLQEKKEQILIYKTIFTKEKALVGNNKKFAKYVVKLSFLADDWVINNLLEYIIANEDAIIKGYQDALNDILYEESIIKKAENILVISQKILGVSNKFCRNLDIEISNLKNKLDVIKNFSSDDDIENYEMNFNEAEFGTNFIKEEYAKAIYKLADNALKEKKYIDAFNIILNIPRDKRTEKTNDSLNRSLGGILVNQPFLNKENIKKLKALVIDDINNKGILEKVIEIQGEKLEYFIDNDDKENAFQAIKMLFLLRSSDTYGNDTTRVKIINYLLSNDRRDLALDVYSHIKSKKVLFLTIEGWCVILRLNFFIIIAFLAISFLLFILIKKIVYDIEKLKNNKKNGGQEVSFSNMDNRMKSNLLYFNIQSKCPSINDVKTAYRKKIKIIHPDIIGHESKEFLEAQARYHEILAFINNQKNQD